MKKVNKKAFTAAEIAAVVIVVLVIVLVAVIIGLLSKRGVIDPISWFPKNPGNSSGWNNFDYSGTINLKHPERIIFGVEAGTEVGSLFGGTWTYYTCQNNSGWFWNSAGSGKHWWLVTETKYIDEYKGLDEVNKKFISDLVGKSCETGVSMLASRTVENKESGYIFNTQLKVTVEHQKYTQEITYTKSDKILQDTDTLIAQLNKASDDY